MISNVRSFTVKSTFYVAPVVLWASAFFAQAQTGKVAVINIQGAIVSTKDGQKAAAELNAKTEPKKKELEQKQNEINALQDQFNKGQNTLSDTTKNDLYKNIEDKKKRLQRDVEDAQAELEQEQQKVLQQLGQKMMAVIERYARDNGYTLVVDVSNPQTPVLYASPSIDITKEIVALYDKSTAQLSAPAAPSTGTAASGAQKPAAAPKAPAPAAAKPPATRPQ
jgi:outer membrane protein